MKEELESGTGLKPVLLKRALEQVAQLAKDTGMHIKLAPSMLPLCQLVRQAVNLQEHLLLQLAQQLGIAELLYTPEQLQAVQQQAPRPMQCTQVHVAAIVTCKMDSWAMTCLLSKCMHSTQQDVHLCMTALQNESNNSLRNVCYFVNLCQVNGLVCPGINEMSS